jgi:hypothetical protein
MQRLSDTLAAWPANPKWKPWSFKFVTAGMGYHDGLTFWKHSKSVCKVACSIRSQKHVRYGPVVIIQLLWEAQMQSARGDMQENNPAPLTFKPNVKSCHSFICTERMILIWQRMYHPIHTNYSSDSLKYIQQNLRLPEVTNILKHPNQENHDH